MRVETRSLQPKGLWPLAIALFATPVIFYQYFNGNWWMSVCCIFAYLTQFVCVFGKADDLAFQSFDTSRPEYESELSQCIKTERLYKTLSCMFYVVIVMLDMVPFWAMNDFCVRTFLGMYYEGGIIVTLLAILHIGCLTLWLLITMSHNIKSEFSNQLEKNINKEKWRARFTAQKEAELAQLKSEYGDSVKMIKAAGNRIIVSEQNECIVMRDEEYAFADILDCSLVDDATSQVVTTTKGEDIINKIERTHDYTLYLNVNSLSKPTIRIPLGDNREKAYELQSLLNVIIARNKR